MLTPAFRAIVSNGTSRPASAKSAFAASTSRSRLWRASLRSGRESVVGATKRHYSQFEAVLKLARDIIGVSPRMNHVGISPSTSHY